MSRVVTLEPEEAQAASRLLDAMRTTNWDLTYPALAFAADHFHNRKVLREGLRRNGIDVGPDLIEPPHQLLVDAFRDVVEAWESMYGRWLFWLVSIKFRRRIRTARAVLAAWDVGEYERAAAALSTRNWL